MNRMDNGGMAGQQGATFIAGLSAGVVLLFVLGVATHRDIRYMGVDRGDTASVSDDEDGLTDDEKTQTALLTVRDQKPGSSVLVEHVELSESGWVVVHEIEGGHVLNALGASRIDKGTHENVSVDLLRATVPGGSYAVILYTDNGNKEFEIRGDLPIIDAAGNPVMQSFKAYGGGSAR